MPSPLYQQFQPQGNNMLNMIAEFKKNPMAVLNKRFNIPQGMNTPEEIIQHLLNSGQVSQEQVNRVMQMKNNPQIQNLIKG